MRRSGRQWGWLVPALLAIAIATLRPGHAAYPPTPWSCIVCGSLGGVDVVLNVILFVPLGTTLRVAGVGRGRAILVGLAATLFVEAMQRTVIPGRDSALGDVVMNTLGTAVGYELARSWRTWLFPSRRTAARLATIASVLWLGILATTLQLMRPAPARGPLLVVPLPESEFVEPIRGVLISLALNGTPLTTGAATRIDGVSWRGPVIEATLRPSEPSDASDGAGAGANDGAIVRIADRSSGEEFAMLARRSDAITFRPRTRAMDLRLRGPMLELAGVFPTADSITPGYVSVRAARSGWTLSAESGGGVSSRTELRASHGWALIAPYMIAIDPSEAWLSAAWMAALAFPVAFWLTAALSFRSAGRLLATLGLLGVSALLGIPVLFGAPWSTLGDAVGAAAGLMSGALCALRFVGGERSVRR